MLYHTTDTFSSQNFVQKYEVASRGCLILLEHVLHRETRGPGLVTPGRASCTSLERGLPVRGDIAVICQFDFINSHVAHWYLTRVWPCVIRGLGWYVPLGTE